MRASLLTSSACALTLLLSAPCRAQPAPGISTTPDAAISETARDLFAKGVKAGQQQRWDQCRAAFLAAYGVKPHPQIAGNLATCELKLGMFRTAAEHVTVFLMQAQPEKIPAERKAAGEAVLREASAKVTTVQLRVDRDGAEVLLDGKPIGNAPLKSPVFLDPGAHAIEVRAEGYQTVRRELDARAGAAVDVDLKLTRPAAAPLPAPEKRPIWPAIVGGSLAAGGMVLGAGLTAAANGKSRDADTTAASLPLSSCAGTPSASYAAKCSALKDTLHSQSMLASGAVGGFVAGGVLALAAAGLGIWAKSATPRIAPVVGVRGGGVVIGGAW